MCVEVNFYMAYVDEGREIWAVAVLQTIRLLYFFYRSAENKMDSSNLSVIFAPNLFHWGDGTEKMNSSTEKRLKLQAAVVQCLIDNAQDLGIEFITTD